ncbi:MAG: DUF2911 domain-containing protein [Verrucomicrobia bacterium]|nr:DUF2911 domain-containing protein [Verrucomicrobiota bacterium]
MKLMRLFVVCVVAAVIGATSSIAQEKKAKKARPSLPDVAAATIDGNEITISYSRPKIADPKSGEARKVWGALVPYGKVWRVGANEATVLSVAKPVVIGGYELAAGKYTLFMVPTDGAGAKLIINKSLTRDDGRPKWGIPYDEAKEKANELARLDLKRGPTSGKVDPFTITVAKSGAGAGRITFAWDDAQYTIDLKNK